jgi:cell division protein FtsI (penicillin-binding protein 3)
MKKTNKVYRWTQYIYYFFIAFAVWCIGFAVADLFDVELKKAEEKARKRIVDSENFRRGNILSFDGKPLAAYYPEYTLFADFNVRIGDSYTVDKNRVTTGGTAKKTVKLDTFRINIYKEFAKSLAKTAGGNIDDYYRNFHNNRVKAENAKRAGRNEWHTENVLKGRINIFQRDAIFDSPFFRKRGRNTTGIYAVEAGKRIYPFGSDFAHSAIGVTVENNVSGIEKICDQELKNGDNIITTIDPRMQDICETVLRNRISGSDRITGGAIILMEVATGDIKAITNLGSYDKFEYEDIHDIYNNATRATIEPGSTFKTVSLMVALETGKVKLSDTFSTKVWRANRPEEYKEDNTLKPYLSVSRIIELSANVGTGNMVDKAFDRNINTFVRAVKDLKITDKIGNLDEISPSINVERDSKSMLYISHGYQVKMAPIHILSFYNAIANDGILVRPRLVRGVVRHSTGVEEIFEPEIINKSICSPKTLALVRSTLSNVVGKGSAGQIAGTQYGISGKTGTAQIYLGNKNYATTDGLKRETASFCGYFPENNPKYSCMVVLYTKFLNKTELKNFSASHTAVPLFKTVSDKIYALYTDKSFTPVENSINMPVIKNTRRKNLVQISEQLDLPLFTGNDAWLKIDTVNGKLQASKLSFKQGIVPDVVGMGLRDAVFLLENRDFIVSYSGTGTIVEQSPEQGLPYKPVQKIHLTLK